MIVFGPNSNQRSSNMMALNKMSVALSTWEVVCRGTEAIYHVQESDNFPRTFDIVFR